MRFTRAIYGLLLAIPLSFLIAGCGTGVFDVAVTGVSLSTSALSLKAGDSETLVATIAPSDATTKTVSWSSDKASVATVSSDGKVSAVAAGSAVITASTVDGKKTDSCQVTVARSSSTVER